MTSKIKVNILADGGDNSIITSDGAGSFTASSGLASSVQSVGGLNNTPAFQVRLTVEQSLSNNTWTKVQWNTVDYDTDSAYDNTTNYRFTVPSGKAGKYVFIARTNAQSIDDNERVGVKFYKNGSTDDFTWGQSFSTGDGNIISPFTSFTYDLSVGDYIEVYVRHNEGVSRNMLGFERNVFAGYRLIGA